MLMLATSCRYATGKIDDPCREPADVTVVAVIDGDTIDVDPPVEIDGEEIERFRFLCVDSSELSSDDCYSAEAQQWLEERLLDQPVRLVFDSECTDTYGRGLAYVYDGRKLVNREQIQQGMAMTIDYPFNCATFCGALYEELKEAQAAEVGAWGACAGRPWDEIEDWSDAECSTDTGP